MITLAYPWLLLVLAAPVILRRVVGPHAAAREAIQVPFLGRLAEILGQRPATGAAPRRRSRAQAIMLVVCWLALGLALARPQWTLEPITRIEPSRDLLVAVDLSGSMEVEDFTDAEGRKTTRLAALKEVLDAFLSRREGDRVGLVFFGSAPFVQAPFTTDLEVCRKLLEDAQVRMAGPRTVLGDAIGLAINVFERSEVAHRVLILFTDGNDTGSKVPPREAARIARDRGITLHAVAAGNPEAVGEEELDEETLRAIAETTGGTYLHADDRSGLERAFAELDALETRSAEFTSHRPRRELFHWPLALALLYSLTYHGLAALLSHLRRGRTETARG